MQTIHSIERLPNIHPGEILREEFLKPLRISQYYLAHAIGVHETRISEIVNGKRDITADTAIRLGRFFNMTPQFWLNLQAHYNLEKEETEPSHQDIYNSIHAFDSNGRTSS